MFQSVGKILDLTIEFKASEQYFLVVRSLMMLKIFLTRTPVYLSLRIAHNRPFSKEKSVFKPTIPNINHTGRKPYITSVKYISSLSFLVGVHSGLSFVLAASGRDDTKKASDWSDRITLDLSLFSVNGPSFPFSLLLTNRDLFSIASEISVDAFVSEFSNFFFASWSSRFCFLHFALLFLNQTCLNRR